MASLGEGGTAEKAFNRKDRRRNGEGRKEKRGFSAFFAAGLCDLCDYELFWNNRKRDYFRIGEQQGSRTGLGSMSSTRV